MSVIERVVGAHCTLVDKQHRSAFGNAINQTASEAHFKKANLEERAKPVIVLGINYSTQSFKL